MEKYLPSKQFVKIMLISLLGAGLLLVAGKVFSTKSVFETKQKKTQIVAGASENQDYFSIDTDGDGLFDWEEALWNTDPRQKDSNGDGVGDKDEVEKKKKSIAVDNSYKPNNNNQTEVFAKQLYSTAAILKNSNGLDRESMEEFSKNINLSITNFNIKDKYAMTDLNLSAVSAGTYYQNFQKLYNSLPNKDVSELGAISVLVQKPQDEKALSDLSKSIILYETLKDGLLKMEVPYTASGIHLAIINDIAKLSAILVESRNIDSDPLKVSTYIGKYSNYSDSLERNFEILALYFSQNGIIN